MIYKKKKRIKISCRRLLNIHSSKTEYYKLSSSHWILRESIVIVTKERGQRDLFLLTVDCIGLPSPRRPRIPFLFCASSACRHQKLGWWRPSNIQSHLFAVIKLINLHRPKSIFHLFIYFFFSFSLARNNNISIVLDRRKRNQFITYYR